MSVCRIQCFSFIQVFEELLLDADYSLNAGNWMWLSASAFFHQYFRVYSPIAFGKKTDPNGDYIRFVLPLFKVLPPQYNSISIEHIIFSLNKS